MASTHFDLSGVERASATVDGSFCSPDATNPCVRPYQSGSRLILLDRRSGRSETVGVGISDSSSGR